MTYDSLGPAELRSATLRGLRWTLIARPTVELVLLGSMVVLARLIPPIEFGRYAVAAIVADLALIPVAGVGAALVQRPTVSRVDLQTGFTLAVLSALALVGLSLVAADAVVSPVFGARTADFVRLSTPLCLAVGAGTVPGALLQRQLDFRRLSIVDVVSTVLRAGVSIGLAIAGLNGEALVLGGLAGGVAGTALTWCWAPAPQPSMSRAAARRLLGYGVPASFGALSWVGFRNCDYALVGGRLGPLQAGFYFRAYQLGVEYQKKVSQVMSTVGFPVLARTQNGEEMDALRSQMVQLLTLLLFPLLALLTIVAPVFVPWLFGAAWRPAVVPTQILAAGGAATLVIDAVGAVLMAAGRARALLAYGWAHFAAYGCAVFFVAPLGLTAVAVAAAVVHTGFLLVAYALMLRGTRQSPLLRLWRDVGPATVSCVGMVAAALPASIGLSADHASAIPYLSGVFLIGSIAYLLTLRYCFPASLRSLSAFIGNILPKRKHRAGRPTPDVGSQAVGA